MAKAIRHWIRIKYIKLNSWEYWPMWLVYLPVGIYFIYLAIRARSFFFFSAANPSIETGGMFFESKWNIFGLMPAEYYPATIYIDPSEDMPGIKNKLCLAGIKFPLIAKPDRGERGWNVQKIESLTELTIYKSGMEVGFLIQAYCDHPLEFSIFYYRHPDSEKGRITSVTLKELLSVTGDGQSTIGELVHKNDRAFLQYRRLTYHSKIDFTKILKIGENELLVPYGNHVLGAKFLNYNHIIDDALTGAIDKMSKRIDGFYFGRYDLRCTSIADLKNGKNIAVLEVNGSGAEPSHIYQPGFSFFKAQSVIAMHFRMMYDAALANRKRGARFMSFQSFNETRRLEKVYKRSVNSSRLSLLTSNI
ncbi:MAG: hypothetical protein ABIQ31_06560 [Ferruginibacter sp.]